MPECLRDRKLCHAQEIVMKCGDFEPGSKSLERSGVAQ